MNCKEYLELSPIDLCDVLNDTFIFDTPTEVNTAEDLIEISKMLSVTSNQYSFLMQLSTYIKVKKRQASREKDKQLKEDLIDKEDIVEKIIKAVKIRYSTLSRLITIKQEYNKELNMNKQI